MAHTTTDRSVKKRNLSNVTANFKRKLKELNSEHRLLTAIRGKSQVTET